MTTTSDVSSMSRSVALSLSGLWSKSIGYMTAAEVVDDDPPIAGSTVTPSLNQYDGCSSAAGSPELSATEFSMSASMSGFEISPPMGSRHIRTASVTEHVRSRVDQLAAVVHAPMVDHQKLHDLCFWGIPEEVPSLKAICWKLSLKYLPSDTDKWDTHLAQQRALYESYISMLFDCPDSVDDATLTTSTERARAASTKVAKAKRGHSRAESVPVGFGNQISMAALADRTFKVTDSAIADGTPTTVEPGYTKKLSSSDSSAGSPTLTVGVSSESVTKKTTPVSIAGTAPSKPAPSKPAPAVPTATVTDSEAETEEDSASTLVSPVPADASKPIVEATEAEEEGGDIMDAEEDDGITAPTVMKAAYKKRLKSGKSKMKASKSTSELTTATTITKLSSSSAGGMGFGSSRGAGRGVRFAATPISPRRGRAASNPWAVFFKDVAKWRDIEKDIRRTHQSYAFFRAESMTLHPKSVSVTDYKFPAKKSGDTLGVHSQVMIRILCLYARLNPGVEYVQGMNELLAPIYYCFANDPSGDGAYAEADAFFCFTHLMSYMSDRFIAEADDSQLGIYSLVQEYDDLLKQCDYELWNELMNVQKLDPKFYALRWLMLLFAMEFQLPDVLRIWDTLLFDKHRFELVLFFAVALIISLRDDLIGKQFTDSIQLLQAVPCPDPYEILEPAVRLRSKYGKSARRKKLAAKKRRVMAISGTVKKFRIKTPKLSSLTPSTRSLLSAKETFFQKWSMPSSSSNLNALTDGDEKDTSPAADSELTVSVNEATDDELSEHSLVLGTPATPILIADPVLRTAEVVTR